MHESARYISFSGMYVRILRACARACVCAWLSPSVPTPTPSHIHRCTPQRKSAYITLTNQPHPLPNPIYTDAQNNTMNEKTDATLCTWRSGEGGRERRALTCVLVHACVCGRAYPSPTIPHRPDPIPSRPHRCTTQHNEPTNERLHCVPTVSYTHLTLPTN